MKLVIHTMILVPHLVPSKDSVCDMSYYYRYSIQANIEDTLLKHPNTKSDILESGLSCRSVTVIMHASLLIEKLMCINSL